MCTSLMNTRVARETALPKLRSNSRGNGTSAPGRHSTWPRQPPGDATVERDARDGSRRVTVLGALGASIRATREPAHLDVVVVDRGQTDVTHAREVAVVVPDDTEVLWYCDA